MSKVLYEPNNEKKGFNHLRRIGLFTEEEDREQVDTLSYISLDKKVESILKGNPNFIAEEIETDFDEPEAENWDGVEENENNFSPFPIDEYSDKDDVIDVQRKANNDIKVIQDTVSKSKAEKTIVDETKDSSKVNPEVKSETSE